MAERLLNDKEAAAWLQVSTQTLANMRCRGEGPAYVKVGGKLVRYLLEDLEEFARGHRITPPGERAARMAGAER